MTDTGLPAFIHLAAVGIGLLLYVTATHLGRQRRHPSAAIAWVIAIVAFPYLALPLFLLLGTRKLVRPARASIAATPSPSSSPAPRWAVKLSAGLSLPPVRGNRSVRVLDAGPAALDALVALIDEAHSSLDLCTFIFADDAVGRRVAAALSAGAQRGVRVRVLMDAIGSLHTTRALRRDLRAAGVDVRISIPLLHSPWRGRTNLRNHRKLTLADGSILWSGGRNIACEYFVDVRDAPAWHDLSFVVEGPLASDAGGVFERDWQLAGGRSPPMSATSPEQWPRADTGAAQLVPSGPDHADDTVHALFSTAIHQANDRVCIATPYFVPDDALLDAMILACRRGVRVTVLLPRRSNHRLADWARQRALRELATAGATIRLLPQMLHAKALLIDDVVAFCGSVNFDGRSLFLNYELTTAFYSPAEIDDFDRWYARQSAASQAFVATPPSWARDIVEGIVRAVAFQL